MYSCTSKAGRPAWTYIQQLCDDTGCNHEDLPEAMNDREMWRERVRDIHASRTTWWWWYIYIYIYIYWWISGSVCIYISIYMSDKCIKHETQSHRHYHMIYIYIYIYIFFFFSSYNMWKYVQYLALISRQAGVIIQFW